MTGVRHGKKTSNGALKIFLSVGVENYLVNPLRNAVIPNWQEKSTKLDEKSQETVTKKDISKRTSESESPWTELAVRI